MEESGDDFSSPLFILAEKNETIFCRALHRKLDKRITFIKMSNPFRNGIPDFYYEGPTGKIAWIEYKWIEKEWDSDRNVSEICAHKGWTQQRHWLERTHSKNILSYTIIGIGKNRDAKAYILSYPFNFVKERDIAGSLDLVAAFLNEKLECNSPI